MDIEGDQKRRPHLRNLASYSIRRKRRRANPKRRGSSVPGDWKCGEERWACSVTRDFESTNSKTLTPDSPNRWGDVSDLRERRRKEMELDAVFGAGFRLDSGLTDPTADEFVPEGNIGFRGPWNRPNANPQRLIVPVSRSGWTRGLPNVHQHRLELHARPGSRAVAPHQRGPGVRHRSIGAERLERQSHGSGGALRTRPAFDARTWLFHLGNWLRSPRTPFRAHGFMPYPAGFWWRVPDGFLTCGS